MPLGGDDDHADDDDWEDNHNEEEETPSEAPEDNLPAKDQREDVDSPPGSPTWLDILVDFWNGGMSETSSGLSTVTKNLDDD